MLFILSIGSTRKHLNLATTTAIGELKQTEGGGIWNIHMTKGGCSFHPPPPPPPHAHRSRMDIECMYTFISSL